MYKKLSHNIKYYFFFSIVFLFSASTFAGPEEDADKALERYKMPTLFSTAVRYEYVDMDIVQQKYGPLSHNLILKLAIENGSSIEGMEDDWLDSCAYEPVYRLRRPFGTFPVWDHVPQINAVKLRKRPDCTISQTYRNRIGGMRRLDLMSEDEVGQMLSENMIFDTTGPGNDEQESNRIREKYELRRTVFLPKVSSRNLDTIKNNFQGFHTVVDNSPFLKVWEDEYSDLYTKEIDDFIKDVKQWPNFSSLHPLENPQTIYLLFSHGDMTPIGYFLGAVEKDYNLVATKFKSEFGFDLPLDKPLITPRQYAQKIKFWLWVRKRCSEMAKLKAKVFRDKIQNGLVVGNIHFECEWDYERLAEAYDWVGASFRPTLLPEDDDLGRLYWTGYGARLFGDLTDKPQMVSVRSNTLGACPRVMPSASSLTYWHNQAIQNGCVGFYIWMHEYPFSPGDYSGICYGNPDKSTLPMVRWNTHMRISKQLGHTKVFIPPKAETGIFVSLTSCALRELGAWKKVFSTYIELCRAKVWNNFVSDQEIQEGSESLERFKIIYIPSMMFEHESVVKKILEYVYNGGTVVCADPAVFSYNMEGKDISHYRRELFGVENAGTKTLKDKNIGLIAEYSGICIHPYSAGYFLQPIKPVKVLGNYKDGNPAVTLNNYGKGKALLFGVPILDIYSAGIRTFDDIEKKEDISRLSLYKKFEKDANIEDQSWIWDITVYNLKNVTGWLQ
jgi:hypothetical protein